MFLSLVDTDVFFRGEGTVGTGQLAETFLLVT